jgi:hypothetical protein
MARKPRDFDAELQFLMEKQKKIKSQKLVQLTGADALPMETLAGALLAIVADSKSNLDAVARWAEQGQTFFQNGGKRGKKDPAGNPPP